MGPNRLTLDILTLVSFLPNSQNSDSKGQLWLLSHCLLEGVLLREYIMTDITLRRFVSCHNDKIEIHNLIKEELVCENNTHTLPTVWFDMETLCETILTSY